MVLSSFKTNPQILSNAGSLPDPPTLDGYRNAFTDVELERALLNTLIYSVGGTAGELTTGFLAAYPTSRLAFPGRRTLTVAFSVALADPLVGLIVPEFFIMRYLSLFDGTDPLLFRDVLPAFVRDHAGIPRQPAA